VSGRFASRAAVVTGAGQGIGLEIARRLALEGAAVLLNDRDAALAEEAARAIAAEGGVVAAAGGDVSDVETTRGLVDRAVSRFGRLDLAVANAGITMHCDFLDYRPEDFDRLLAVNLRGSFFLAQAAARRFCEQGTPGRILFLSSVTGHMAIRQMAAYGMTKAALEALARNLSLEMAPLGITVNAIAPGATVTERWAAYKKRHPETILVKETPSPRTLERWVSDSVAKTPCGCKVEPDGKCPHGVPSWLIILGFI